MATSKDAILPYKLATVYNGAKEQFISFHYWSLTKKKYIRKKVFAVTKGAKPNKKQRLAILNQSLPIINTELRRRNGLGVYHEQIVGETSLNAYISAIQQIIDEQTLPKSTLRTFSSLRTSFTRFEQSLNKTHSVLAVDKHTLERFKKFMISEGKANKTINEYLSAAQQISDILKEKGLVSQTVKVDTLRVKKIKNQTEKYRPLTREEKEAIFEYTRTKHPGFYLFILSIYYTCIRPSELHRLTIQNINLESKSINVPWYKSKNGLTSHVQILQDLHDALTDYAVSKLPKSYYLFGRSFVPSTEIFTGKSASDKWRLYCNEIGISTDAKMYGLKHSFNVDYVENNLGNIEWDWLRRHNRHATIQQTQDYIYSQMPYFLDETQATILNYYNRK